MTDIVFILNSPFQYYLALELIKRKNCDKITVIFLYTEIERSDKIIDEVICYLNSLELKRIDIIRFTLPVSKNGVKSSKVSILRFLGISVFFRVVKLNHFYNELYLGEYRNLYISFLANLLNVKNRFVIDDGLASFKNIYNSTINLKLGLIRKRCYELNSFFTNAQYYLSDLPSSNYKLLDAVCFVGSNSVENRTIDQQSELRILEKIQRSLEYNEIYYRPHRFEDKDKVDRYQERSDICLITSSLPFELDLIISGNMYKTYVAYNSTVIVFLALLKKFLGLDINLYNIVYRESDFLDAVKYLEACQLFNLIKAFCKTHDLIIDEIYSK
ncbi:hypothetical protein OAI64_02485 [Schleiferiaceae bacterium]|nr:hypothetical protein [Schleiferiaceae bacterium]